jgi:hypothetical protein
MLSHLKNFEEKNLTGFKNPSGSGQVYPYFLRRSIHPTNYIMSYWEAFLLAFLSAFLLIFLPASERFPNCNNRYRVDHKQCHESSQRHQRDR